MCLRSLCGWETGFASAEDAGKSPSVARGRGNKGRGSAARSPTRPSRAGGGRVGQRKFPIETFGFRSSVCKGEEERLGPDGREAASETCKLPAWGVGNPSRHVGPGSRRGRPLREPVPSAGARRRRGGIRAPRAVPALGGAACAGTSRPRLPSAGGGTGDAGARGVTRGAGGPGGPLPACARRRSPRAHNPANEPGRRAGERENRFSGTSPPLCHSLRGAERAREGRGPWGGLGTRAPLRDLGSGTAHAFPARLCAAFASQALELARDRGGAGGRAARAGCRGRGGRGRAEVTPGSGCHCPAPCHSARAGPGIGSLAPLRTHLAFTYPGRAVER